MNQNQRKVRRIVVHCSAGPAAQKADAIVSYHTLPVARGGRGWKAPGYHYIVEADGKVVPVLSEERVANGAKGFNADSIHLCYTGGILPSGKGGDTRTPAQKAAIAALVADIRRRRGKLPVTGHRDLSPDRNGDGRITPDEWIKICPGFDAAAEYSQSV